MLKAIGLRSIRLIIEGGYIPGARLTQAYALKRLTFFTSDGIHTWKKIIDGRERKSARNPKLTNRDRQTLKGLWSDNEKLL